MSRFYILFDIKKQNEQQILDIINQNLGANFNQEIRTPFFYSTPNQPDYNTVSLGVQVLEMTIYQNKPFILKKLVIDCEHELVTEEQQPNNKVILYEGI